MKNTIYIMLGFIVVYLGFMYLAEMKYHYDWSPYPQKIAVNEERTLLSTEILPSSNEDSTIQDSVITQGILPTEDKNYLSKGHEDFSSDQDKQVPEQTLTQEATSQQAIAEQSVPESKQEDISTPQLNAVKDIPLEIKPLTYKEKLAEKNLVDIETLPVKIFLDLRYATENNFTGKKLYKRAKCYLKKPAALALAKAAKEALKAEEPFYLCAYDCYRPTSVQKILVNNATEPGFVSRVSNHSRGMAIDVGPCDSNGEALLTPTEFDTFSPLSAAYYQGDEIPQIAIQNRTALQKVMKKAGFSTISKEWWHFDYKGAKNEELLNIKF